MKKKAEEVVASIALYGAPSHGAGFIVRTAEGKMFGDGNLRKKWSMTDALFLGVSELHGLGMRSGICEVTVDFPSGPALASFSLSKGTPYFGELKWGPGRVITISAEAIMAAAEKEPA